MMQSGSGPAPDIATPLGQKGLTARLTSTPGPLALAAQIGSRLAQSSDGPWRVGKKVIVATHGHVCEALARDLDFLIAPINEERIGDVDKAFVLGMDRHAVLIEERRQLYQAFSAVDQRSLRSKAQADARSRTQGASVDVVEGLARPVAAATAQRLFGIKGSSLDLFQDVARAIFAHTFLNLSGDAVIKRRALTAAQLLEGWLDTEIGKRRASGRFKPDMMGFMIERSPPEQDEFVRRTLAGMLVGAVDTTATAVAKIIVVASRDRDLMAGMTDDLERPDRLGGWCLEALRRWPHNPILFRQAARDTELGGTRIKAKDELILWTQAAMLDAGAFPEPEIMRPDRPQDRYLHYGGALHSCAGRSVNAWQIPLLVGAVLQRGIKKVGRINWAGPFPHSLMVEFR